MIIQDLLKDQIAVVTGGTRGIGYAIVQKFLEQGATVILFGSRQSSAEAAIAKLHSENPEYSVTGLAPDITDLTSVEQTFSQIVKEHKRIDILVNNAGISARDSLYDYSEADFDKIMDLNV